MVGVSNISKNLLHVEMAVHVILNANTNPGLLDTTKIQNYRNEPTHKCFGLVCSS